MIRSKALAFACFAGVTAAAATIGTIATRRNVKSPWYRLLRKPRWQPPSAVFAPVWTSLYVLVAWSGYRVWKTPPSPARSRALALWGTQLALNAAWPWLFFAAKSPKAGLAELVVLVPTIGAYAREAHRVDPAAAWLVAPYLAWSTFATGLNASIVWRNG